MVETIKEAWAWLKKHLKVWQASAIGVAAAGVVVVFLLRDVLQDWYVFAGLLTLVAAGVLTWGVAANRENSKRKRIACSAALALVLGMLATAIYLKSTERRRQCEETLGAAKRALERGEFLSANALLKAELDLEPSDDCKECRAECETVLAESQNRQKAQATRLEKQKCAEAIGRAKKDIAAGRYKEAERRLGELYAKSHLCRGECLFQLARVEQKRDKPAKAIRHLEQALHEELARELEVEIWCALVKLYIQANQTSRAKDTEDHLDDCSDCTCDVCRPNLKIAKARLRWHEAREAALDDVEQDLREAIRDLEGLPEGDLSERAWPILLDARIVLAGILKKSRPGESVQVLRQALKQLNASTRSARREKAIIHHLMAVVQRDLPGGEKLARASLELALTEAEDLHRLAGELELELGQLEWRAGYEDDASDAFTRAKGHFEAESPKTKEATARVARCWLLLSKLQGSEEHRLTFLRKARDAYVEAKDEPGAATARLLIGQHEFKDALRQSAPRLRQSAIATVLTALKRVQKTSEKHQGDPELDLAVSLSIAEAALAQRPEDWDLAEEQLRRVEDLWHRVPWDGPNNVIDSNEGQATAEVNFLEARIRQNEQMNLPRAERDWMGVATAFRAAGRSCEMREPARAATAYSAVLRMLLPHAQGPSLRPYIKDLEDVLSNDGIPLIDRARLYAELPAYSVLAGETARAEAQEEMAEELLVRAQSEAGMEAHAAKSTLGRMKFGMGIAHKLRGNEVSSESYLGRAAELLGKEAFEKMQSSWEKGQSG